MARVIAPGLALLAACFSPDPPAGSPCVGDERCPAPQACIGGFCRAPGPTGDAAPPVSCPTGFVRMPSGACHLEVIASAEWPEAELDCEQRGGHLAVPSSATEALELRDPRWIGITDRVSEGAFRAVTGAIVSFTFWGVGEPFGGDPVDCVHTGFGSRWHEGPCTFPFAYVCEYDGLPAVPGAY